MIKLISTKREIWNCVSYLKWMDQEHYVNDKMTALDTIDFVWDSVTKPASTYIDVFFICTLIRTFYNND